MIWVRIKKVQYVNLLKKDSRMPCENTIIGKIVHGKIVLINLS